MLGVIIYLLGMCAVFVAGYEYNKKAEEPEDLSIIAIVSVLSWFGVCILVFCYLDTKYKLNDKFTGRNK